MRLRFISCLVHGMDASVRRDATAAHLTRSRLSPPGPRTRKPTAVMRQFFKSYDHNERCYSGFVTGLGNIGIGARLTNRSNFPISERRLAASRRQPLPAKGSCSVSRADAKTPHRGEYGEACDRDEDDVARQLDPDQVAVRLVGDPERVVMLRDPGIHVVHRRQAGDPLPAGGLRPLRPTLKEPGRRRSLARDPPATCRAPRARRGSRHRCHAAYAPQSSDGP